MKAVTVLKAGILPYAGDDGPTMGQSYRLSLDLEQKQITLALRTPDETGTWARTWRDKTIEMGLPQVVLARMKHGEMLAPSLREIIQPDGTRYAVRDLILEVPAAHAADC